MSPSQLYIRGGNNGRILVIILLPKWPNVSAYIMFRLSLEQ